MERVKKVGIGFTELILQKPLSKPGGDKPKGYNHTTKYQMTSKPMQDRCPHVSVIILTYNGSKYIEALLESLADQSYPEDRIEIIAIDNASTDGTP